MEMVSGVPGAGKTYHMVTFLLKHIEGIKKTSEKQKSKKDIILISNIDGLKMDHLSLESEIGKSLGLRIFPESEMKRFKNEIGRVTDEITKLEKAEQTETKLYLKFKEDLEKKVAFYRKVEEDYQKYCVILSTKQEELAAFFNVKFFEDNYIKKNTAVILCVDEIQRLFGSLSSHSRAAQSIFLFFEMHRHLGIDIIFALQTPTAIPSRITSLCDYHRRAMPKGFASGLGFFLYHEYSGGKALGRYPKKLRIKKKVFEEYKSQDQMQTVKSKNALVPLLMMLLASICMLAAGGVYAMNSFKQNKVVTASGAVEKEEKAKDTVTVKKDQPEKLVASAKDNDIGKDYQEKAKSRVDFSNLIHGVRKKVEKITQKEYEETRVDTFYRCSDDGKQRIMYFYDDRLNEWIEWSRYIPDQNSDRFFKKVSDQVFLMTAIKD